MDIRNQNFLHYPYLQFDQGQLVLISFLGTVLLQVMCFTGLGY